MRFFLQISFDGSHYKGWQRQPDQPSVQQTIEESLQTILQEPIAIVGCGRTDAGVHASVFYLHFDCIKQPNKNLVYKLNSVLPHSIAVQQLIPVTEEQHARYSATKRSYVYHIHFNKNPFLNQYSYHCYYRNLDFDLMQNTAANLIKYKNFSPLSKTNEDIDSTICHISQSILKIDEKKQRLELNISANRYLHNMIRRIVGLLINVGRRKISEEEVNEVLSNSTEFSLNFVAPPQGLFLSGVEYPFIHE